MSEIRHRGIDVLLLFVLLMARVRIDTLADLVLPTRHQDVIRLPLVQRLFSPAALALLEDWLTDPLSLALISLAFAGFLIYVLVHLLRRRLGEPATHALKLALIFLIVALTVVGGSLKLVALRQVSGPGSYAHDGGVIQTEEAIRLFLAGSNPYVEDYTQTPLAEWGIDFRSALYHYPYLPWTFVFSAPFYLLANLTLGWFDARLVYLLLFVLMLLMAPRLAGRQRDAQLLLVMLLGLNPIMGSDVIFGQNDLFVLFWIVAALWALPKQGEPAWRYFLSAGLAGLAVASKPTAWFVLPFYLVLLLDIRWAGGRLAMDRRWLARLLPLALVVLVLVGPYLLWNAPAFVDDVWSWSSGTSAEPYQIRGWGFANIVLALGLVESRLSYFPFWIPELLVGMPLLAGLLWRQVRRPDAGVGTAALYGAILFIAYAFFSRFFNENYVGFAAALLAVGTLADWPASEMRSPSRSITPSE